MKSSGNNRIRNKTHSKQPNFNHKLVVQKMLNPSKGCRRCLNIRLHLLGWFAPQIGVIKPNRPWAGRRVHLARWHLQGPNACTKRTIKSTPCRVRWDKRWCNYCMTRIPCDCRYVTVALPVLQFGPGKQYGGSREF